MAIVISDNGLSSEDAFMKKIAVPFLGRPFYVATNKGPRGEDLGPYNFSSNAELLVPHHHHHLTKSLAHPDVLEDPITDIIAIDSFHLTIKTTKELREKVLLNSKDFTLVLTTNQKGAGFNSDMHIIPNRQPGNREVILFEETLTNIRSAEKKALFSDSSLPFIMFKQEQPSPSIPFYDVMYKSNGLSLFDNTTLTINAYFKKISTASQTGSKLNHEYININKYINNCLVTVMLCNRSYKKLMLL